MAEIIPPAYGDWDGEPRQLHLAPMSGVTDLPFRLLARECGADVTITEFTSSAALTRDVALSWSRLESHPAERPFIPQIFGGVAEEMVQAALMLADQADIIDLNFGCPAPKVTGICAGAALMGEPENLVSMVKGIIDEVSTPVTAKMRLGTHHEAINVVDIAKELADIGTKRLCVHGRTLKQRYTGNADWSTIAQVVNSVEIPVIANGDIIDSESAAKCLEQTGATGLMIGRAAIGRPDIFARIKTGLGWLKESELPWNKEGISLEGVKESFRVRSWCWDRYVSLASQTTGMQPKWLKRHATAFTKGLPGAKAVRVAMHGSPTMELFAQSVSDFLNSGHQKVDSHSSIS